MILTKDHILKEQLAGRIHISPLVCEHVGPNSVDLTLSPYIEVPMGEVQDMAEPQKTVGMFLSEAGAWLYPGQLYLGMTNEECGSDHYVTCIEGRSSIGRLGIQVHHTAGFGDLGFKSRWTLEITVVKPVKVYPNIRICQAMFYAVQGTIGDNLYSGKYVYQPTPRPSEIWRELRRDQ